MSDYEQSRNSSESSFSSGGRYNKSSSERGNIILLLFLYVLQGIPLGLAGSIPMILQNKNISYKEQVIINRFNILNE